MVAKASLSPLSIAPQEKKSKKLRSKSLESQDLLQQADKNLSPFSQMLLQHSKLPKNSTKSKPKTPKISSQSPNYLVNPQKKTPSNQTQKLLTQKRFEIQSKQNRNSLEIQNQLREALKIKAPTKTLQDLQNIAEENNLNPSKITLVQNKAKQSKKISKYTPSQNTQTLQEKPKEPNLSKKITNKIQTKTEHKAQTSHSQGIQATIQDHLPKTNETAQENRFLAQSQDPQIPKDSLLKEFLNQPKEEKETNHTQKNEKSQEIFLSEAKKETQFKIAQSRETITHFSNRLKEEIANYKPPFTKLSMELNPRELGKLEVTITKKGKELQISINTNNPNALQTFVQNQNDFRATLANVGFSNVELSFSQGESQKQNDSQKQQNQKRNKNSLEEHIDAPLASSMEIKMLQYA